MSVGVGGVKIAPAHGASSMAPISVTLKIAAVEDAIRSIHSFDGAGDWRLLAVGGETERELARCDFAEHRDCVFVSFARVFEVMQRSKRLHPVHRDVGCESGQNRGRIGQRKCEAAFDVTVDLRGRIAERLRNWSDVYSSRRWIFISQLDQIAIRVSINHILCGCITHYRNLIARKSSSYSEVSPRAPTGTPTPAKSGDELRCREQEGTRGEPDQGDLVSSPRPYARNSLTMRSALLRQMFEVETAELV